MNLWPWLGISFAPAIEDRLRRSSDILSASVTIYETLTRRIARLISGPILLGHQRGERLDSHGLVEFARRELASSSLTPPPDDGR